MKNVKAGHTRPIVCLDAGHYGKYNRSPVVPAYYESEMVWKLHLMLKKELESYGIEVWKTRADQNKDLDLESRGRASKGADLFLSIHSNAADNEAVNYVVCMHQIDDNCGAMDEQSKEIAGLLANCVAGVMGAKGQIWSTQSSSDRDGNGYKDDYYGVLRGAHSVHTTGVIIEHGFHTNKAQTNWLLVDANLEKLAKAEAKVIADYYGMQKTSNTSDSTDIADYVELNEGDIVSFTGNIQYNSSDAVSGTSCAQGKCKITKKYQYGTAKHPYHVVRTGDSGPYGWVDIKDIAEAHPKKEPEPEHLYRIRKSWDDAKSQKGAYKNLEGAIQCCQNAGEGYHVFDWNGKIVYSYVAPKEEPKEEVKPVAVYDLDYPEKNKIVELDNSCEETELKRDCVKAIKMALANNADFDVEIAKTFFRLAPKYHIDPMMAISQSILETGWFTYVHSAVKPEQHNYCGMGVVTNGVTGNSFDTIEDGVRAQLQHLYAYGCKDALPDGETTIIDPRFKYVTRGIAPYWQNLAGRWAVPGYDKATYATPEEAMKAGNTYGQKIRNIYVRLSSTDVTEEDIEKYFPVEKPVAPDVPEEPVAPTEPVVPETPAVPEEPTVPETPVTPENPVTPDEPVVPDISNQELSDNMNYVFRMIRKLFEAIINFFKNLKD